MADEKKAFHLVVAEKLIGQLERGAAPWQKPWAAGESYLPYNPTTGKTYKGINSLQLLSEERADPRWLTYKQAQAEGAQVRRGEKGSLVQYWKFEEERTVTGGDGKPVLDAAGRQTKEVARLRQPRVFFATVFNAEQIDGLPPLARKPVTWNAEAAAEARLNLATVRHDQSDPAFYRRSTDVIHMPGRGQFPDAISYYQVGLHELAHWSGHPSRMNREGGNPFGSPEYAREELRAEIASLLMGEEIGIGHEPGRNSAAYVASWVKDLQEQPLEIFRAAAEAEKIRAYITQRAQERNITQEAGGQAPVPLKTQPPQPTLEENQAVSASPSQRIYLAVPFGEKTAAKSLGARWDAERKSWYAPNEMDAARLSRWLPGSQIDAGEGTRLTPHDEFASALKALGMQLDGGHPLLDGKPHRVVVAGDRQGEAAGFYVAYGDGHPAGYAKNNRTGEEVRWKAKGYTLTEEQKAALAAEAATKLQLREVQTREQQADAARRVEQQLRGAKQARSTPYLEAKRASAAKGVFADKENRTLIVPGYDAEGKMWTAQYIQEDGAKRFAKGARKEGCFHVVGGLGELSKAPAIVIAEGYATASVIAEAAERRAAVVSAFDAGNLEPVARALREKFPDKVLIVAGDDDRNEPGRNPGRDHATKAAEAAGAKLILPTFATGEQAGDPKRFSDFCDVKVNSSLGMDGLKEQIEMALDAALPSAEQTQAASQDRPAKRDTPGKPRAGRGELAR
jgi:putative DNA primase/helicase